MRIKQIVTSVGTSLVLLGTLALGIAAAAPSNAPSSMVDSITCTDGANSWDGVAVSNGEALWTPGFITSINDVATHKVYLTLNASATFYPDEPIDGQTQIELFSQAKNGNRKGVTNVYTCTVPVGYFSADDPENPFGMGGDIVVTVTVFEAGNSR
ncbi:MAG: hypothetical protein WBW04_08195 [Nitrolancea sp.]